MRFAATMVEPTGVPAITATRIPAKAHTTANTAAQIVTDKKLLNTRMAARAGKMTRAEIKREPTRFIASTMMTAITTAISKL